MLVGEISKQTARGADRDLETEIRAVSRGCEVVANGQTTLRLLDSWVPDLILCNEQLDDMSGADLIGALRERELSSAVVMVLPEDGLERGAECLAAGAVDFLLDPLEHNQTMTTLGLVARSRDLVQENRRLRQRLKDLCGGAALVGCSPVTRRLSGVLARVAESSATVLIEGRPGTGKSLAAQIIHASSRRSEKQLVIEYCESLTVERIEDSLARAAGGTLVLEDVDQLSGQVQSRVVRYIKERSAQSGPDAEQNTRLVATTAAHLPELVSRGKFREDLYYRLNVFPIVVPSLQERRDDLTLLAHHFLEKASQLSGIAPSGFTTSAMLLLETHPWPGNIAQLQDAITRAHTLAGHRPIDRQHLLGPTTGLTVEQISPNELPIPGAAEPEEEVREEDILPLEAEEKRLLARALKATKGNVRRAAQLLRIGRATLYRKIQIYKLKLN